MEHKLSFNLDRVTVAVINYDYEKPIWFSVTPNKPGYTIVDKKTLFYTDFETIEQVIQYIENLDPEQKIAKKIISDITLYKKQYLPEANIISGFALASINNHIDSIPDKQFKDAKEIFEFCYPPKTVL